LIYILHLTLLISLKKACNGWPQLVKG
jgi:hypothetical protein